MLRCHKCHGGGVIIGLKNGWNICIDCVEELVDRHLMGDARQDGPHLEVKPTKGWSPDQGECVNPEGKFLFL